MHALPAIVCIMLFAWVGGCTQGGPPEATEAQVPTLPVLQGRSQESQRFEGSVGPYALVRVEQRDPIFEAAFARAPQETIVNLTLSKPPALAYRFELYANGSEEPVFEEPVTDRTHHDILLVGIPGPYRAYLAPIGAEVGFDWEATVTQFYAPAPSAAAAPAKP